MKIRNQDPKSGRGCSAVACAASSAPHRSRSRKNQRLRAITCALAVMAILGTILWHQSWAAAPTAANAYQGLVPGNATLSDVLAKMGPSPLETPSKTDLRYPVAGRPELNDRFYFQNNKLALVTSASPDSRYPTRERIVKQFGKPEAEISFQTQSYLDYTQQGLRFICDATGNTTGVLYFAPHPRRIPEGYPNVHVDLRRAETDPPQATTPPADFLVGASQVSIAPKKFDDIAPDNDQKPTHLAEDLFARAVIFQRGDERVVFIGLDVFGMGMWDVDKVRERLREKGFPNVVVAMSHTHANVDTIGFYGYYPAEYVKQILAQTEQAVMQAAKNLSPVAGLKIGSAEMPLAGGRVVDLIRNGRDPGVVDPTVSIVQAIGKDGKPIANLIHLACHPEVIRLRDTRGLSPDFVGTLCNDVTRELGGQTVFLNGALGGMLTPDTRLRTQAAAEEMGHALAKFVVAAAENAVPSETYDVWLYRRPVEYPVTAEAIIQYLEKAAPKADFAQHRIRSEMNLVWIGDAQFITIPGELLPDLGLEIMSHMPGKLRMIVGLANAELGYLIPSYDFRDGGYEERTGPGAAGGAITRSVGLELAPILPPQQR
ncbi:hypothetical protein [Symmachiella dynata]|uniref:hypothetical protein n=1 Tax=Symmachiella dynata TaxID=2527995 RepID=UPI0030ED214C